MAAGITYNASAFVAAEELYNVKSGYRLAGGANLSVTDLSAQEKIPPLTPLYVEADGTNAWVKKAYVVRNAKVQANVENDDDVRIEKGNFINVGDKFQIGDAILTVEAITRTNADYDVLDLNGNVTLSKGAILSPVTVTEGGATNVTTYHEAVVYEGKVYVPDTPITSLRIVKNSGLKDPGDETLTVKLAGNDIEISGFTPGGNEDAYDTITITGIAYSVPLGAVLRWSTSEDTANPDTVVAERTANFLAYAPVKVETGASVTLLGRAFEINEDKLYIPVTDADKASLGDRFMFI